MLAALNRILVLTGSGISAESGIPTFRGPEGYWRNFDPTKLATEAAFVRDPTEGPEGVETFPALERRVVAAAERWLKKESTGAYPAFVTHDDVIKVLIAHYIGLEVGRSRSLFIDNASVSVVVVEADHRPLLLAMSWSPQPGWLRPFPLPSERPKSEGQVVGDQDEF